MAPTSAQVFALLCFSFLFLLTLVPHRPASASRLPFDVHGRNGGLSKASACNQVQSINAGDKCMDSAQLHNMSVHDLVGITLGGEKNDTESEASIKKKHTQGSIFRVYIGVDWTAVEFTDVPIRDDMEVHLILSFGIDYDQDGKPRNGKFLPFWDDSLTPSMVKEVKKKHPNVKVMVSLGGDTINDGEFVYFQPHDKRSWMENAVSSLSDMGEKYGLDGIDIDYEHFKTNEEVFAECMGEVIKRLKEKGQMVVASIAPFDEVESHYKALWDAHHDLIDYVNFQFYTYDADTSTEELLRLYDKAARVYKGGRILTSFTTDHPDGGGDFAPHHIFDASQRLQKKGLLPGMFSWVADTSQHSMFQQEKQAESLLANKNNNH